MSLRTSRSLFLLLLILLLMVLGGKAFVARILHLSMMRSQYQAAANEGAVSGLLYPFGSCSTSAEHAVPLRLLHVARLNAISAGKDSGYLVGLIQAASGDATSAQYSLRLAAERGHRLASLVLGSLLYFSGDTEQAIAEWKRAGSADWFIEQGQTCSEAGDPDKAKRYYDMALRIAPSRSRLVYATLLHVYYRNGSPEELEFILDGYRRSGGLPSDEARLVEAKILAAKNEHAAALVLLEQVQQHDPDDFDAFFNAGKLAEALGEIDKARAYYERAHQIFPSHYAPLLLLGDTYRVEGRLEEAFDWYQKACCGAKALAAMGAARYAQGRYDEALKYYQEAAELSGYATTWYKAAKAAIALRRWALAKTLLEKASSVEPGLLYVHLELARVCLELDDVLCAKQEYRLVLTLNPDEATAELVRSRLRALGSEP